jgi:hypothetical protein
MRIAPRKFTPISINLPHASWLAVPSPWRLGWRSGMGSLIKKRRKRMRKKKHKKMLKATRWQRRAGR